MKTAYGFIKTISKIPDSYRLCPKSNPNDL